MEANLVSWFEIPVLNMDRAKVFYEAVFNINVTVQDFEGTLMGWFPMHEKNPGASGSLIYNEAYIPSETKGVMVYFNSNDITKDLKNVVKYGGKVLQEKTQISPEIGYMGVFIDSEGNRISLYTNA
ncbi:VOC family protein [uncultured Lacinutrix sp.]|uniref:VOC family protein n=1 Tax=uncultured Lacinutrix sp. TaxID=574032 RepID=UPI0026382FDE|nr:VOC family protein [uncultured Lacinutrix sp.]